jgi:hypothetical protein
VIQIPDNDAQSGVHVAPPPVRHEPVPQRRRGYVWIPGYWDWINGRHFWAVGRWVAERRGYHWQRHLWVLRDGSWCLQAGSWTSDKEGRAPTSGGDARAPMR